MCEFFLWSERDSCIVVVNIYIYMPGVYLTCIFIAEATPISYHVPGTGTYTNIWLFVLMSFGYVTYYTYEYLYLYSSL